MIVRRRTLAPIDFGGLQIFDYTADAKSGSSLAVIDVPPGATHAEAWSKRSDKYYLVVAGRIDFTLQGERVELAAGDFCLVAQGVRFSYANRSPAPAQLVLVHTPSFDLASEVFVTE